MYSSDDSFFGFSHSLKPIIIDKPCVAIFFCAFIFLLFPGLIMAKTFSRNILGLTLWTSNGHHFITHISLKVDKTFGYLKMTFI